VFEGGGSSVTALPRNVCIFGGGGVPSLLYQRVCKGILLVLSVLALFMLEGPFSHESNRDGVLSVWTVSSETSGQALCQVSLIIIIIILGYLPMLITQSRTRQMAHDWGIMSWKGCGKKRSLLNLGHYSGLCLLGLKKITEIWAQILPSRSGSAIHLTTMFDCNDDNDDDHHHHLVVIWIVE
jgi:hypothetical protein